MIAACPDIWSHVKSLSADRRLTAGPLREIVLKAALLSGMTPLQITGNFRTAAIYRVRQAVYVAASRQGYGMAQIGRRLGRDHTTIIHGVKKGLKSPEVMELVARMESL